MHEYEKMYYTLFNAITDALRLMETSQYADAAVFSVRHRFKRKICF